MELQRGFQRINLVFTGPISLPVTAGQPHVSIDLGQARIDVARTLRKALQPYGASVGDVVLTTLNQQPLRAAEPV